MDKDFEKLIDQVMDENDAVLITLTEIEADEKKANQRLYILTEADRPIYTRARLDLPMLQFAQLSETTGVTLRQDLTYSADQFGEANPDLDTLSDEAIFELADWYEYLWTK